MKIKLLCIGKTTDAHIMALFQEYQKRLKHYVPFAAEYLELRKKPKDVFQLKEEEGKLILGQIDKSTTLVLLDEKGKMHSSTAFANFLQKLMNSGSKEIVFVIGGAYGFSEMVYNRADHQLAFSAMTFTHQMIRLIFVEQLYRGFTILKKEKYHH